MKPWLIVLLAAVFFGFFALSSSILLDTLVVSDETLFLTEQARSISQLDNGRATASFLAYPLLPFLGFLLFPNPIIFSASLGAILATVVILLSRQKDASPLFQIFLVCAVLFSPAFLFVLVQEPVHLIFGVLLLSAAFFLLRYRETSSIQNCFLLGLCLGTAVFCRCESWWVAPLFVLILVLFFRGDEKGELSSLLLVTFFPLIFFSGVLFFINWVFTGSALSFLRDSPYSSYAVLGSPFVLPEPHLFFPWLHSSWPSLLPFVMLFFHDRLRTVFAAGFLFISYWSAGGIHLQASSVFLVLALPFLFPIHTGKFFRTVFLVIFICGSVLSWWQVTGTDSPLDMGQVTYERVHSTVDQSKITP